MSDVLKKIEAEIEELKQNDLLELMDKIIKKMKKLQEDRKNVVESHYGIYHGLLDKDAQHFVNELREE